LSIAFQNFFSAYVKPLKTAFKVKVKGYNRFAAQLKTGTTYYYINGDY
jgi:hypothetical protein